MNTFQISRATYKKRLPTPSKTVLPSVAQFKPNLIGQSQRLVHFYGADRPDRAGKMIAFVQTHHQGFSHTGKNMTARQRDASDNEMVTLRQPNDTAHNL